MVVVAELSTRPKVDPTFANLYVLPHCLLVNFTLLSVGAPPRVNVRPEGIIISPIEKRYLYFASQSSIELKLTTQMPTT